MHQARNSSELAYAFRLKRGPQPPCPGLQTDVYVGPIAPDRQSPEKNTHLDSPVPLVCLRTVRIEIPSHLLSPRLLVPALVGKQLPAASRQSLPRPVSPNHLASDSAVSPRDIFRPAHGRPSTVRTPLRSSHGRSPAQGTNKLDLTTSPPRPQMSARDPAHPRHSR
eukprot:15403834-Heterocapsa_arctica.AAC.1